jgi:hypothetical protein
MNEVPSVAIETKCTIRSFLRWRRVLLGIVCLFVVFAVAVFNCPIEVRRAWLLGLEYDKSTYARISKAIAADPRHRLAVDRESTFRLDRRHQQPRRTDEEILGRGQ